MQKTKFKLADNEYRIVVQSRNSLAAIRNLDNCCLEGVFLIDGAPEPGVIKGAAPSIVKLIAKKISTVGVAEALKAENNSTYVPAIIKLPDGKQYDPMKPLTTSGTSGGSVYKVILTLHEGLVSYSKKGSIANNDSDGEIPRIRVSKSDPGKSWKDTVINAAGDSFQTVENTHMAHTGNSAEQTAALVMRGAASLLALSIDF